MIQVEEEEKIFSVRFLTSSLSLIDEIMTRLSKNLMMKILYFIIKKKNLCINSNIKGIQRNMN